MVIILFTASYPYSVAMERTFLLQEVDHLASRFDRVYLVPQTIAGGKYSVPPRVEVEEGYARARNSKSAKAWNALASPLLYGDFLRHPSIWFHPQAIQRLIGYSGDAELTRKWIKSFIKANKLDLEKTIFYTYWFDQTTLGVGLAKRDDPRIRLVSRAHGGDLYPERHRPAYIPCRDRSMTLVDRLFPDSDRGTDYIRRRYPGFSSWCRTERLGVRDPGFLTPLSTDGVFRMMSCSLVVPVKRLHLLLEGICRLARSRPGQTFSWNHFGEGYLKKNLEETAQKILPSNIKAFFPGYPSLEKLMDFYKTNPVDVFMNVSESEGTPVAVMEAISCGIPVIATAVGGNPEIVTEENGILLDANPCPEAIADAIKVLLDNPEKAKALREGSRNMWRQKYDSERNFRHFTETLAELAADRQPE